MTEPEPLQQVGRTGVRFRGRTLAYFSGCDYFRLASEPRVLAAARDAIKTCGLNVAASRLTTGNHVLYQQLERQLARFFGSQDALVLADGYTANLIVAQALAGQFSHALIDAQAHPSLQDAAVLLDCPVLQFKHRDAKDVEACVHRCAKQARLILLTDGLFSFDGSAAPLDRYLKALPRDAVILVDDAHGAGVLGHTGKGCPEYCGLKRSARLIQTAALSKAFGCFGGVVLANRALRRRILARSRLFVGSTPLPLPLAAAALEATEILRADKAARARLWKNAALLKSAARKAGLPMTDTPGPILCIVPASAKEASLLKTKLLAAHIYPPFLAYPGGPESGYFRFVVSSQHTPEQMQTLCDVVQSY